ncbi:DUF935 domain-containing protein [Oricola sp.]|uniref:DUF935 domain-containing protein n=1 Tax=Oricola sp. TaxID=1979950 RepID=UPI0025DFC9C8|nr:DUF935 domain-containing protein [Oricola sp.]MCI5075561.1 DUF935 domain-containing protein [Oricola sp.]
MAKPQLLDAYGRPIEVTKLKTEQARSETLAVRRPNALHPASGLTPVRLANILRDSIESDPENYLALAEDMEERNEHYAGVLGIRKRQVASLEVTVEAACDDARSVEQADLVREMLTRDGFEEEVIDILDATGKGFSGTEIIWDTSEGDWRISRLEWKDPRNFRFSNDDGVTPLLRAIGGEERLNPFQWIWHQAKMKSGLPIRGGLARGAAWSFFFKSFTLKDWAIFCEAYGQPLRLGKFHPGATEKDKETLMRAVASIGSDFAAVVPESMAIEFVQAQISGSHELFERRADWLDRQISKLVLGQTATTDAIAGGHAVGKVHDQVRGDIEDADARQLRTTIKRDLVRPLIDLNYGPQKNYPDVNIGRPDEVDIESLVNNVATLVPLGLKVGMATMRDKIGVPDPDPEEELLGSPVPPPSSPHPSNGNPPDAGALNGHEAHEALQAERLNEGDAISIAARDVAGDEWEAMTPPVVRGLAEEIAEAESVEEVRAILDRRRETMNLSDFTDLLAQLTFQARLSGEADEDLA